MVTEVAIKHFSLWQTGVSYVHLLSKGFWDTIGVYSRAEVLGLIPLLTKPSGSPMCPLPPDIHLLDWFTLVWRACDENMMHTYHAFLKLKVLSRARQPPPMTTMGVVINDQCWWACSLFDDCCQLIGIGSFLKPIKEDMHLVSWSSWGITAWVGLDDLEGLLQPRNSVILNLLLSGVSTGRCGIQLLHSLLQNNAASTYNGNGWKPVFI